MITRDSKVHVVLVRPYDNRNIGAVARAMKNTGFDRLHLVAAQNYDAEKAAVSACGAVDLLEKAQHWPTLTAALVGMDHVVGFTARSGKNRAPITLLPQWATQFYAHNFASTALLFGPEENGLTNEELYQCRELIRIPAAANCTSYNLSQAVLLSLYELSRHAVGAAMHAPPVQTSKAAWSEFEKLDRLVEAGVRALGFVNNHSPMAIPAIIKNLLRRCCPDQREMRILQGLFGSMSPQRTSSTSDDCSPVSEDQLSAQVPGEGN
ncbi:MAG: RNA methyltransferase [Oligoflexia bacterium]|nr:RNA methyltransferase [Oligoflexia bacterium]